MKTVFLIVIMLPTFALACPRGSVEYQGSCAIELTPAESPTAADSAKWVSDEKPPKDKMPSYEREGIKIVNAPSGVEQPKDTAHDMQAEAKQQ